MLDESFIFLPKIGSKREKQLWKNGISNWDDFLREEKVPGIGKKRKRVLDSTIKLWRLNYEHKNHRYFYFNLAGREHHRLFDIFRQEVMYLDIETTEYYGDITVVGLYNGEDTLTFVKGHNLDNYHLLKALENCRMLVTFNGSSFDIPLLEKFMGRKITIPHVDLRHVCAKIGLKAPLKVVEQIIGIERDVELDGVSGEDAVSLWYLWKTTGKAKYLEKLIEYNMADVVNLEALAEYAVPRLWEKLKTAQE